MTVTPLNISLAQNVSTDPFTFTGIGRLLDNDLAWSSQTPMSPPQTPQRQIVTATSFKFPMTPISPVPGVFSLRECLPPTSEPAFPPAEVATLLKSKSFAVKDGTFNPIELQTVKDYIEHCGGWVRVRKSPKYDTTDDFYLIPHESHPRPMAWAHMNAVTPEWGKTQSKREFGPHPRPKVDWTNSCLNFNWKRSEVFEDVVTSMHEYSFELATHSMKNVLNGPDLDGFDCWWFRNYPDRPTVAGFLTLFANELRERVEWFSHQPSPKQYLTAAARMLLVKQALDRYDWHAPGVSRKSFYSFCNAQYPMLGDIQRYCKQHVAELREYSPGFKTHAVRNHDPTDFLDRLIQEVRRFDWVDNPHNEAVH
ncbi:uncharacterized protein EHS24_007448 [Apiotrichum porosum]|uniref:Uncharacterized protein n=1 Tax=Apiotrichum porosum TaxID=105984 RepID=A0A427XUE9_9TREE|nr:uncharacterized protein EHS24_007448 [Apiotrichum porosum]RSH82470.1 hypothetical protein EHS24_007448 [Apiotrichum porosum]